MKIKYKKIAYLTLDNGKVIHLEHIGEGLFCHAWKNQKHVYIITKQKSDWSKEIICGLSGNPYFPKCKFIGDLEINAFGKIIDSRVYIMPLYRKLTPNDKEAWKMANELMKIRTEEWVKITNKYYNKRLPVESVGWDFMNNIINRLTSNKLKKALKELMNLSANYGSSYAFEFSKDNLSVSNKGHLILRDVIYDLTSVFQKFNK